MLLAPVCTATFSHAAGFDPPRLHLAALVGMTRPRPKVLPQSPFEAVKLADRSVEDRSCGPRRRDWDTRHQPTHASQQSLTDCACCLLTAHLTFVLSRACDSYRLHSLLSKLCYCPAYIVHAILNFSALLALALLALLSWDPPSPLVIMTNMPSYAWWA